MEKCMIFVDQNQYFFVVFLVMGIGNFGYLREIVVKEMFSIVYNFGFSNFSITIFDVYFVLYDRDIEIVKVGIVDDISVQIGFVGLNIRIYNDCL